MVKETKVNDVHSPPPSYTETVGLDKKREIKTRIELYKEFLENTNPTEKIKAEIIERMKQLSSLV